MEVLLHQIDAFADAPFTGNPAAVMPLLAWLPDELLQRLAEENRLSETAFYTSSLPPEAGLPPGDGPAFWLRWFSPTTEIDLCGHATLAAAAQIFDDMHPVAEVVHFYTRSGWLGVQRRGPDLVLDLPAAESRDTVPDPDLIAALGVRPVRVLTGPDELVVVATEAQVRGARPSFTAFPRLARGVILTAPGDRTDFVSRFFAPGVGVDEDPVTGSAHAQLAPLWAREFGRRELSARQLSSRTGRLHCTVTGSRVLLTGRCHRYLDGVVRLPHPEVLPTLG
ncbi:PhzF family phenazine biosynthesis protein [Nocardia vermiculata]|uniref:PhzF family phenazine biosynthesis protein n=1 Tax=Nocardia vermiculata TaxID=257274 RepID=A0A846Y6E8_9NOCA|nr:PhzF family phenazine biosynthesis protein [Nocardia vermiculata]NKY52858.1 PhzF family phenazine biosynthesis protein [Nocardia vermiculata]